MELIDTIVKTISGVSQTTIKKGKDVKNIAKLNLTISDEERKIDRNYMEIGRLFYEMHKDDCEKEFAELIVSIDESKEKIKQCNEEIKELKGIIKCPGCNAEIMGNLAYCPNCGCKIEKEEPEEESQEESPDAVFCKNCGAKLDPEYKFCVKCGTAVEHEAPIVVQPDGSIVPVEKETSNEPEKEACCKSEEEQPCKQACEKADDENTCCDAPVQEN